MYPGCASQWTGVSLPPWLPKRFAQPVITHAELALQDRFTQLLEKLEREQNPRKRSISADTGVLEDEIEHVSSEDDDEQEMRSRFKRRK